MAPSGQPWVPMQNDTTRDWGVMALDPTSRSNPIMLAECYTLVGRTTDGQDILVDSRANAYLMAAAPKLLDALKMALDVWTLESQGGEVFDRMREAIALAEPT